MDYQQLTLPPLLIYTGLCRCTTLNPAEKNSSEIRHLRADLTSAGNVWHITPRFGAEFPGTTAPEDYTFPPQE